MPNSLSKNLVIPVGFQEVEWSDRTTSQSKTLGFDMYIRE
jgi:hypothetical protein